MFLKIVKENLSQTDNLQLTTNNYIEHVCRLIKEKAHFVNEFWELGKYFFIAPESYDADVIKKRWKDNVPQFVAQLKEDLNQLNPFKSAEIEHTFKLTAEKMGIGSGSVMQVFRVCISGVGGGPALFEVAELLGKEEVVKRLQTALEKIKV